MNKHDAVLRKNYDLTLESIVRRILKTFDKATPADIEAGAAWYPQAGQLAADLATQSGHSKECCAAVISHLSPRNQWVRNVLGAHMMLVDKEIAAPGLTRGVDKALAAIALDEHQRGLIDESTFGQKTLRFYWNIMGDTVAVTVDVWALKSAGLEDDGALGRKGVYEALQHAFRLAARRRSVEPSTMQATTWVVTRGGHA